MNRSRSWRIAAVALGLTLVAAACGDSDDDDAESAETTEAAAPAAEGTIVEVAVDAGNFTTLVAAVEAAGLAETLSGEGPFTVFAPTDAAFEALPEGLVAALLEDTDTLAEILTYHVVSGEVLAEDVVDLTEATSVQGDTIDITVTDEGVMVDSASVIATNIGATNGVIHVIDSVIIPDGVTLPEVGGDEEAMEDEAMEDEAMEEEEAVEEEAAEAEAGNTLVDVAVANGNFTTVLAAAEAAGLVDVLAGPGPFTVFAPTDDAFAALPEGTVEGLLEDTEALTSVLTLHVVAGEIPASEIVTLTEVTTVNGEVLPVVVEGDSVMVGTATVVLPDVEASNGVIHVIDSVLLPSS